MRTSASRIEKQNRREESPEDMDNELHELFLDELADLLSAEQQLTKALPKMAKAAKAPELREAFESHLEETERQVTRLVQVFESVGSKTRKKTCKAMQGLIEEGSELIQDLKGKSSMDAGLIAAAQKVEHYEIASYGTVRCWAERMGHQEAVELLEETLEEEKAADETLTGIAENLANSEAE